MFGEPSNDAVNALQSIASRLNMALENVPKEVIYDALLTPDDREPLRLGGIDPK